jgi:hypothetical protein
MTGILDLIAHRRGRFVPEDSKQYVALQLAKRLHAVDHVQKIVSLIGEHSVEDIASIFRRTQHLPPVERLKKLISAFPTDH